MLKGPEREKIRWSEKPLGEEGVFTLQTELPLGCHGACGRDLGGWTRLDVW